MENSIRPKTFHILSATIHKGEGAKVWDLAGKSYIDFHAGYATLNQGHCHPEILRPFIEQAQRLTLTSNAISHDQLELFSKKITSTFKYQRVIPMNSGSEACETAVKYARRWGYEKKGVPEDKAIVVVPEGTYSGSSFAAISASSDMQLRKGFGPFLPGFVNVPYGKLEPLEEALSNPYVVALLLEPIQGEAGVILPPEGFLKQAKRICEKKNVLFIADEIQTGLGRTGKMLACDHENVRPDILILGKALSGGFLPVSAVLCDAEVADSVSAEEHHSTFSSNPLACRVAVAAIEVVLEGNLIPKAGELGELFRREVTGWNVGSIREVRGQGLLNCVEFRDLDIPIWGLSRALEEVGVLALPISSKIMRFSPPLVISKQEMEASLDKIHSVFKELQ